MRVFLLSALALFLAGCGFDDHTVGSLAAAEAVLNRQQKESGTLLLDIGAGTTNLVVLEDGEVQHVAVIPIGGIHVTNDLAIGLQTDLDIAELVKVEHASLEAKSRKGLIRVDHEGKHYQFDGEDIQMIAEARIEELLEFVDKELKKIHRSRKLPGGVSWAAPSAGAAGRPHCTYTAGAVWHAPAVRRRRARAQSLRVPPSRSSMTARQPRGTLSRPFLHRRYART